MKPYLFSIIVTVCIMSYPCMGQNPHKYMSTDSLRVRNQAQIYMPMDSVPDWVKAQVTPAEYKLWKEFSHYFQVDYSILRQDLPADRKSKVYQTVRDTLDAIKAGEFPGASMYGYYTFQALPSDNINLSWKTCELIRIDENMSFVKKTATVYRSKRQEGPCVICSVWYIYDTSKEEAYVIKYEFNASGDYSGFEGMSGVVSYSHDSGRMQGHCDGSLSYWDTSKAYRSEDFNTGFTFSPAN